jgi:HlyD family secretion protein
MTKRQKILLFGSLGTIVLVLVVGFILFRGSKSKYELRFDKIAQGDLNVYVTATGTINPVTTVDVGTQVSGIVSKLYADYNSVVRKGQIIAQIDSTFLVQSVKDAEASMDKARAQYQDSKRTLDRTKALLDRQLVAQSDYDIALTTYETNSAQMKSAQSSLERAKINLSYATIYAPIDGVVINRAVNIGQTVAASFSSPTLYTIANDMRKMQVETTVDETDIGKISIGQKAAFSVDAYPEDKFAGTVSQIRLSPTTVSNVVNYIVIIDVNNDDLKLMPGMTANVKLLVGSSQNVLRVSNVALRFQPPTELIDTSKVQHRPGGGFGRNGEGAERTSNQSAQDSQPSGEQQGNSGMKIASFSEGDRERFRAIRDSIQKAHGGEMNREDIRAEMQKVFAKMVIQQSKTKKTQPLVLHKRTTTTFGITQTFPEYEKSTYEPDHQSGSGRIWIQNSSGKLEPVYIHTGLSDGKYTEISAQNLKVGDQIVLSANAPDDNAQQVRSPLTGSQQGVRIGGGGGGPR